MKPLGMSESEELAALLEEFRQKARCRHTQSAAHQLWRKLRPRLISETADMLGVAWEHSISAEGPKELDSLVDTLIAKVKENP